MAMLLLLIDRLLKNRTMAAVVLGLALSGCHKSGESLQPVSGKVTFQGKPVAAGVVRFSNLQIGIDMTADIRPDGSYEIVRAHGPGLPEGPYQVTILPPRVRIPIGTEIEDIPKPPPYPDIPEKYRQPSTSELTLIVKPGGNRLDVDMQP